MYSYLVKINIVQTSTGKVKILMTRIIKLGGIRLNWNQQNIGLACRFLNHKSKGGNGCFFFVLLHVGGYKHKWAHCPNVLAHKGLHHSFKKRSINCRDSFFRKFNWFTNVLKKKSVSFLLLQVYLLILCPQFQGLILVRVQLKLLSAL